MALSDSYTNYFQGNASRFHMTTSWSATQNIANNTSTITAVTTVRPEGAISSSASKNGSITIAGNTKNFTFVLGSIGAGVTKEVGRHTFTFSHASNGTGSAAISSTLDINITYSGKSLGSLSTSGTATLNTIPRTSSFTIPSSFTMGDAFTVSITRASSSFTHWVRLSDGSTNLFDTDGSVGTSQSVNVALSTLAARSPNAMSREFTVTVWTYNGDTVIGNTSKTITANVPTNVKPTFSALTVSENVSTVASLVGAYVQTKSKLNLEITGASGLHGSTIKSYNITGVGHNVNSSSTVTGLLSVSGDQTIKGTVIDSRGQSFERSIVVNILPYTPPTLTDLSFRRTLANKTEAPLGDNVTVRANVKVQSLIVNGVEKNSIWYQVQSAQSGGWFADKANTTSTDLTKSYSDVWVGYSVDHSYNFRVRAADVFDWGGWSVGVIPTGVVTQQWGSKTTSFGKMIDNTGYNVQVGTGGIQSDGPIIDKNGNQMMGFRDAGWLDLNTITTAGSYRLNAGHANGFSNHDYGQLLVVRGGGDSIAQLGFTYNTGDIFVRTGNPPDVGGKGYWRNWTMVSKDGHTHAAGDITSGAFADARIPNLNASKITAGTFSAARIPAVNRTAILDTRTTNQTPNWYYTNYPQQKVVEFKQLSVIGITAALGAFGTYCTVETYCPWYDSSGGGVSQMAYNLENRSIWTRRGSTTSWTAWLLVV